MYSQKTAHVGHSIDVNLCTQKLFITRAILYCSSRLSYLAQGRNMAARTHMYIKVILVFKYNNILEIILLLHAVPTVYD
jgi:hypothetical protein